MRLHHRSRADRSGEGGRRDRVFVADPSGECARLGKANVTGFRGCSAPDDATLCGDERAVLLLAQADGLRRNAASTRSASEIAGIFLAGRFSWTQIRSLVGRLKLAEVGGRSFAQCRRVLRAERGPHTASRLVFSAKGGRRPRPLVPSGAATARRDRLLLQSVSGFVKAPQ
jgi:hypothetical protein